MAFETFTEGYSQALVQLERKLEESINRNGGYKSASQAVNILNDVILFIHQEKQSVSDVERYEEQEPQVELNIQFVEDVFNDVFNSINGGKK